MVFSVLHSPLPPATKLPRANERFLHRLQSLPSPKCPRLEKCFHPFLACAVVLRSCLHRQKCIPLAPRSQSSSSETPPVLSFLPDRMPAERIDVVVSSRTLVRASDPPENFPAVLEPSKLDLILGSFHIYLIAVYPAPAAGFRAVAAATEAALPTFLSRFFPFAGRVVTNASTGVPEIACDNAGAELVEADVDTALADVDFADADRSLARVAVPFSRGLALSLQLVRFKCGGFALSWGTDHLLVDGHGLTALPNAWAELLLTGRLSSSWEPYHDRATLFRPRDPPRFRAALDAEFTRYTAAALPNPLLTATLVRRNYVVSAAAVARLRAAASTPARRATRLEALSAHVWKLLAAAVGTLDGETRCRMAWLVDGRRCLMDDGGAGTTLRRYLGNVVTYATREAGVEDVATATLAEVAAMAGEAIAEVFRPERFEELVDWMEARKAGVFREGGKWTEVVGTGNGSPALVVSAFVPFHVEGDFGFGRPRLVMPWVRPGRLGSAAMTVARSPRQEEEEDGAWVVTARLWPRLADVVDADQEGVFKPATAERLGFGVPDPVDVVQHTTSRM